MQETKIINVGQLTALGLKQKLIEFRSLVVQQGNAQILDQLDKLIENADNKSKPIAKQKFKLSDVILGNFVLFGLIILPWGYGVYKLIKHFI